VEVFDPASKREFAGNDRRGLELYGETLEGRCFLSGPPKVTEREEPVRSQS
jgi:hypothetical protein